MDFALIWGVRLGLVALLATPLIVSPSTIFPFIVGKALYSRTVIEIVFAFWLMLLMRRPEYRPPRSTLAALFGLFVLGALVTSFFGVSFQRSVWSNYERMTGIFDLAHWFAVLVILMTMIKGITQWRIYLTAVLAFSVFIAFLGVLEANQVSWGAFNWLRGEAVDRLTISLGNATYVGAFGMVSALLGLGMFADALWRVYPEGAPEEEAPTRGRRRRARAMAGREVAEVRIALAAFYLLAVAGGMFLIFASGSRGAGLGFAGGLLAAGAVYSIWGGRRWLRLTARWVTGFLVVLVVGFLLLRSDSLSGLRGIAPILDRTIGVKLERSSHSRAVGSQSAVEAFADRPLVGWGYENFATVWNRYMNNGDFDGPFPEFDLAHNKLAEILATTGLIGFVPYAAFWIWAVWMGLRLARRRDESQLVGLFVMAGIIGFLIHLMFLFDTTSTMLLLIVMLAFVATGEAAVAARAASHTPGDLLAPRGAAALAVESDAERASSRRRRRRSRRRGAAAVESPGGGGGSIWQEQGFQWAVSALIFAVLITSLVFTQLAPLRSGRAVLLQDTPQGLIENIGIFGQLGTISRTQLVDVIASELDDIDPSQREAVFDVAAAAADAAADDEPENLKVRLSVARLYRAGGLTIEAREAELLAIAREHTNEALEIAPNVFESLQDGVLQAFAEQNLTAIEAAVARWKQTGYEERFLSQFDERLEEARAALGS